MNVVIKLKPSDAIPNNELSQAEYVQQELDFMHMSSDAFASFEVKLITDSDLSSPQGIATLALSNCNEWTSEQIKARCKSIQTSMLQLWEETKHEK